MKHNQYVLLRHLGIAFESNSKIFFGPYGYVILSRARWVQNLGDGFGYVAHSSWYATLSDDQVGGVAGTNFLHYLSIHKQYIVFIIIINRNCSL